MVSVGKAALVRQVASWPSLSLREALKLPVESKVPSGPFFLVLYNDHSPTTPSIRLKDPTRNGNTLRFKTEEFRNLGPVTHQRLTDLHGTVLKHESFPFKVDVTEHDILRINVTVQIHELQHG